ncbi:MAG: hypothetical protein IJ660_02085 [Alphaproteobacteria bacterium]|nr:hypothetical protein [Alphaproteobacteria bacterium]
MRQKKSKFIYYIAGAAVLLGLIFASMLEFPVKSEHVEEVIPNDFLSK